jgi:hypothetical protein
MGKKVQRVKTPVSETQMASAIMQAWEEMFGHTPTKEQVNLVLAQNALETGNRNSMWNFNVGNITTNGQCSFDYIDDLVPHLKFRAYRNLEDGTKDYLKLLSGKNYSQAWQHIIHPDPVQFSKALGRAGYYGDYDKYEPAYTKAMSGLYNRLSKSHSYEEARAQKDTTKPLATTQTPAPAQVESILDKYLSMLSSASDFSLKKLYRYALPNHDILIRVQAPTYTDAIEFSRVLCAALEEDLLATAYTYTDGHLVEVECSIPGPKQECLEAAQQMTRAIVESFKDATAKIGGIDVVANCQVDKRSSYQPISYRTADTNYRKFLLKFIPEEK